MNHIEKSIVVDRPVSMVYNQWTQFETFPMFMSGVVDVRQLDANHVHWKVRFAGRDKEWDAEITEQEPDRRISWKSIAGDQNAGTVRFRPLGKERTEVTLVMAYEPMGGLEKVGSAVFGRVKTQVMDSLRDFKDFSERHSEPTGAWRGEVVAGEAHQRPFVHRAFGWPLIH
jgi:uncharacterized membrane protein